MRGVLAFLAVSSLLVGLLALGVFLIRTDRP